MSIVCPNCHTTIRSAVGKAFDVVQPPNLWLYRGADGMDTYPVYGVSGSISAKFVFYLFRPHGERFKFMPVWVTDDIEKSIRDAAAQFDAQAREVGPEDDLGLPPS